MKQPAYMRFFIGIALVTCLFLVHETALASGKYEFVTPGGNLEKDIAKAQETAHAQDKFVLLKFHGGGCRHCGRMESETFRDTEVKALLARHAVLVPITIKPVPSSGGDRWSKAWAEEFGSSSWSYDFDGPKHYFHPVSALYEKYDVRDLPSLVFIDGSGNLLGRHEGYLSKENFLLRVQLAASGESALDHAIASLEQTGQNSPAYQKELADAYREFMRYPEALAAYEWCLEEGMVRDPSFVRQRATVFPWLIDLAKRYPPAKQAVQARLAEAKAYLLQEWEDMMVASQMASDVFEINRLLDKMESTKQLYEHFSQESGIKLQPNALLAAGLWKAYSRSAFKWRTKSGHKKWLANRLKSEELVAAAEFILAERELRWNSYAGNPESAKAPATDGIDLFVIQEVVPIYEEILKMEQPAHAGLIADSLLASVEQRHAFGPLAKAGFESGNMHASHAQWAWDSVKAHPESWENLVTLARILTAQGQEELAQKMIRGRLEKAGADSREEEKRALRKALRKQRGKGHITVPLKN